jgi:formate dehydrogenase maturation protein FdhE
MTLGSSAYDFGMRESWERRLERAAHLAARDEAARPLLLNYARILALQRDCYETLRRSPAPTGSLERDLATLRLCAFPMLDAATRLGPPRLAEQAIRLLDGAEPALDAVLQAAWQSPSGQDFFPKMVLQPYAQYLREAGVRPGDRRLPERALSCPFCGGPPQLSILHGAGTADGGGRQLLCATCFTRWPFRRILCANCGEEDEHHLGYFHSEQFDHLRVDACETCGRYLKTVDLTRLGHAVPLVDEVAGASLDVWAVEQGYEKIELNLLGL